VTSEVGDISKRGLVEFEMQNLLSSNMMEWLQFCDHCVVRKTHRLKFDTGNMCQVDPLSMLMKTCEVRRKLIIIREGIIPQYHRRLLKEGVDLYLEK